MNRQRPLRNGELFSHNLEMSLRMWRSSAHLGTLGKDAISLSYNEPHIKSELSGESQRERDAFERQLAN